MNSVVVKSFNRPWLLGVCLESIREYMPGCQVVVADDGTDPLLWRSALARFHGLAHEWLHTEAGEAKWPLCRDARFGEVVPTCGRTWNAAHAACRGDTIFLIEDDCFLTRPVNVEACGDLLRTDPDLLCLIGLRERCAMENGTGPAGHGAGHGDARVGTAEKFTVRRHEFWPWSFAGHLYRRADWDRVGPWPEGVATGPMEQFVIDRLRALGWLSRPYGVALDPFCQFDSQTSVRTDHPSTYAGRFRHVDAINAAWMRGEFRPTFADVRAGCVLSYPPARSSPLTLHYPRALRQINFVTGHELCGDLRGAEADARWLSQANAEAERYGETPWTTIPESCKS